jgi:ATP/maltotriose-dependent transcriptional regulator MalT
LSDCIRQAGKTIEHEHGYRAERARISGLIPIEGTERDVGHVATRLGIPIGRPVPIPSDHMGPLSPRETEIPRQIASGSTTKEVAKSLSMSQLVVKTYMERILR